MLKNILTSNAIDLFFNFKNAHSFRQDNYDSLLGFLRNDSLYDRLDQPVDCYCDEFDNDAVDTARVDEAIDC